MKTPKRDPAIFNKTLNEYNFVAKHKMEKIDEASNSNFGSLLEADQKTYTKSSAKGNHDVGIGIMTQKQTVTTDQMIN